jgi:WD40 repeat protein
MSSSDEFRDDGTAIHLEATATGQGVVNQAGRDQHIHYSSGTRRVRSGDDGAEAVCPYPGLASFTAEQAAWFFGRDRLTATLVSRLDACLAEGGPVMVVAASGAGKSSLLRAGLLPKIAAGAFTAPGSRHWPRVVFTPGAHPLREAAAALASACPGGGAAPAEPGAGDLDALLAEVAGPPRLGGRAVLVVDQFEQLFRLCENEEERSAFISWLCGAARASGPGEPAALVACAVRADFYLDCTRYPQLRQALQGNQLIVGAMTPGELREAITCPAEAAGLGLDPGLTELLLADLRAGGNAPGEAGLAADDRAGRLPLLAHALQATWRQRHGGILTVEGYRAAGGIEHAIAETAERVYRRLEGDAEREVRGLFLRLVKIGDAGGEDIRRPVPRLALLAAAGPAAAGVIDDYTASRLVTQSRETVQITHEALLRAWPRLAGWLDEDRAGQLTRQQVEDDAAAWDLAGRDTSRLYRGARLASAIAWAAGHPGDLTTAARDFLAASRRRARLTAIALRAGVAVLAALTMATTVFSVVAFQQRSAAVSQRDLAVYNQVLAEAGQLTVSDPASAAQLLVAAYRMHPGTTLRSSLVSTENQPLPALVHTTASVDDVAVSSDGRTAVTLSNGHVTLWDITDLARPRQAGRPLPLAEGELASSVAVSPDGRTLAAGSEDGSIALWDISSPSHPVAGLITPPGQDNDSVEQAVFSPDGRVLASRDYSGNGSTIITLWAISAARHLSELTTLAVPAGAFWQSVAFSANGRTLAGVYTPAGAAGGGILLWDIADPSHPRELGQAPAPPGTGMGSAAFSPDGSILAGGSSQGIVTLWDVSRPAHPRVLSPGLSAGSAAVISATFSTDGQTLTAVNADGTARQWDTASPSDPRPVSGTASTGNTNLQAAAFSSNAQVLATGSFNGIIGFSPVPGAIGTIDFEGDSAPYGVSPG